MSLFNELEDEAKFVAFVKEARWGVPNEITRVMHCSPVFDDARLKYAFDTYMQCLNSFTVLLHSSNPDQYKRAGALLFALYKAKPITDSGLESSSDELESGFSRLTLADGRHALPFVEFFEQFHQEVLAFNLAYVCCAAYVQHPVKPSFDYLRNVCFYLKKNSNLSVDSFFMLFKSLMFTEGAVQAAAGAAPVAAVAE